MKKTLENIINKVKRIGRKTMAVGVTLAMLANAVYASRLSLNLQPVEQNPPEASGSIFYIVHHTGAPNGPGWGDSGYFFDSPNPAFDMYEDVSGLGYPWDELSQDGKRDDNMDTIVSEIEGRWEEGIPSIEAEISANIEEFSGQNNMTYKKIIGRLYDVNDPEDENDDILLGTYNCWNMHHSGQKTYLTVRNGSSHRWTTSFNYNNPCDLDDDGDVDWDDWAILANEYKDGYSTAGNYLADVNGPDGHSDGYIGWHDVKDFSDNWLDGT